MSERMNNEKCDAKSCSLVHFLIWAHFNTRPQSSHQLRNGYQLLMTTIVDEGPNVTRSLARRVNAKKAENVRDNVSKQVMLLITPLENELRDQVFSQSDKEMIVDTRLITDLKTTAGRIKLRGAILSLFQISKERSI